MTLRLLGLGHSDIASAIEELAVNFEVGIAANRATDAPVHDALAKAAKH